MRWALVKGPRGSRGRPTGFQGSIWPRGFKGHWGSMGGPGGPRGSRGHLGDPMGPSGWFDESSDDS